MEDEGKKIVLLVKFSVNPTFSLFKICLCVRKNFFCLCFLLRDLFFAKVLIFDLCVYFDTTNYQKINIERIDIDVSNSPGMFRSEN